MKFREFIQKKHAVMGQTYLSGSRLSSSSKQAGIGNSMMRTAKRAGRDETILLVQKTADTVYFGCFDRFLQRERRQDGRNPFRDHRFPRTWGAEHQNIRSYFLRAGKKD